MLTYLRNQSKNSIATQVLKQGHSVLDGSHSHIVEKCFVKSIFSFLGAPRVSQLENKHGKWLTGTRTNKSCIRCRSSQLHLPIHALHCFTDPPFEAASTNCKQVSTAIESMTEWHRKHQSELTSASNHRVHV